MNEKFLKFIQKHNIDIDSIYDDLQIYSKIEINRIIASNELNGQTSTELVSVADIIGYDYSFSGRANNIAKNFGCFFGNESEYQSRSLGMLEYSNDEIIEKLYLSFKKEPIRISELDNGRKVVSSNGMHRYTLLRLHYINELKKAKGNKEQEEFLKRKYEIPVEITRVDLFKTYCQYIIRFITEDSIYLSNVYDENYKLTGKVKVSFKDKIIILNDEELLNYTKNIIRNIPEYIAEWFINDINMYCEYYESFKLFIEENFSEEITLITAKNGKKGRGFNNDIL